MTNPGDYEKVRKLIADCPEGGFYSSTEVDAVPMYGVPPHLTPVESFDLSAYMTKEENKRYSAILGPLKITADEIMNEQNRIIDEGKHNGLSYLEDKLRSTWDAMRQAGIDIITGGE